MTRSVYYYCFAALLIAGCKKKELPLPEQAQANVSPPFQFSMLANGAPVSQSGGINNYYMFSSYTQDTDVYVFEANVKPTGCNNCPNSLSIAIRDAQTTAPNQATVIANALYPGYFPYHLGTTAGTLAYDIPFSAQVSAGSYLWDFGDGSSSTLANPIHTYAHPGTYTVNLSTVNGGCSSSLSNVYKIAVPGSGCQLANVTSSTDTSTGIVTFSSSVITGTPPYTYAWDLGDGSTSALSNPTHTYTVPGIYHTSVTITDALGNSAVCNYDYLSAPFTGCTTAFSQGVSTPLSNPHAFSNVVVTWSDALGNVYTSDNAAQPAGSYFQVVSVEDYSDNELGQHTKKLHVKFSCKVYNGANSIQLSNADAVIAVAYR